MNKKDRQIHQMLTAVASFIEGKVSLFPKSSSKIQETFTSEVKDLDGLTADYAAAETALRVAGRARDSALETLKSDLDGVALLTAALDNQALVLPRSGSMTQLIHVGRAFLQVGVSMKKDFIEHGFPADFAEQLEAKIDDLAKCIEALKAARGARSAVAQNWTAQMAATLSALAHVDVVARNAFKDDIQAQASYDAARIVRRASSRKEEAQKTPAVPQPQQPSPPATIATAAA